MYPPELETKIQEWRAKASEGTLTLEDMKEALLTLRQDRLSAMTKPKEVKEKKPKVAKTTKTKKAPVIADLTAQIERKTDAD